MAMVRTVDLAEMLRDLEHQAVAAVLRLERVQNGRQMAFELHVDDGADDLGDASGLVGGCGHENSLLRILNLKQPSTCGYQSASAPEMISISSLVIIA